MPLVSIVSYVHSKCHFYLLGLDSLFQKDKEAEPMVNDIAHFHRDCSIFEKVAVETTFGEQKEAGDSILF